jgi:hypothetical protein
MNTLASPERRSNTITMPQNPVGYHPQELAQEQSEDNKDSRDEQLAGIVSIQSNELYTEDMQRSLWPFRENLFHASSLKSHVVG